MLLHFEIFQSTNVTLFPLPGVVIIIAWITINHKMASYHHPPTAECRHTHDRMQLDSCPPCPHSNNDNKISDQYVNTIGVNRNETLFIHESLSLGCINFKNLCAYYQEEVLRILKHTLIYFIFLMILSQNMAKSK